MRKVFKIFYHILYLDSRVPCSSLPCSLHHTHRYHPHHTVHVRHRARCSLCHCNRDHSYIFLSVTLLRFHAHRAPHSQHPWSLNSLRTICLDGHYHRFQFPSLHQNSHIHLSDKIKKIFSRHVRIQRGDRGSGPPKYRIS